MVIIDPHQHGKPFGEGFARALKMLQKGIDEKDDDVIVVIAGLTGAGKSTLGLHVYEHLTTEPTIEQIALTREDFAKALRNASETAGYRYVQYDEGKLNRRDWQSEWSKELLEIYHDIRGLNIFHVWCTAYPELLDSVFVRERVKAFIYIYTKDTKRPRKFLYFTKKNLIEFLEKNEKLSVSALKKYGRTHALLDSWFVPYNGALKAEYAQKKKERMRERVRDFWEKYGGDLLTQTDVGRDVGVTDQTIVKWAQELIKERALQEEQHYVVNGAGKTLFTNAGLLVLRGFSEKRKKENPLLRIKNTSIQKSTPGGSD